MEYFKLIVLGIIIASNNFSFSLGLGALGVKKYHWRIILVFTLVEFVVPLVGLMLGQYSASLINEYSSVVGSLLLIALGLYLLVDAFKTKDLPQNVLTKLVSWQGIFLIALGLSLDNLLVGFGLGLNQTHPILLSTVIAVCSFFFTWIGLKTGTYLKKQWSNYVEIFSAVLLIVLGFANYFDWF